MAELFVITDSGRNPLDAYKARLPRHGSTKAHRRALTDLISGKEVTVFDSELAIAAAPEYFTIYIRFPRDGYRTQLDVRPMSLAEHRHHCPNDHRTTPPGPDNWRSLFAGGVRWQLYSCVINGLFSARVSS